MTTKTNPYKAVSFVESAVEKALSNAAHLIADVKYDGVRGNILVDNTANAKWLSRVSKSVPALSYLDKYDHRWQLMLRDNRCLFPDGFMLDGELMVKGVDFNTGSGLLRTKWLKEGNLEFNRTKFDKLPKGRNPFELDTKKLRVILYAVLPYHIVESGEDYDCMNLSMRTHVEMTVELLREYFPEIEWCCAESYEVFDMVELSKLYEQKRSEGHEGLVVKDPFGIYRRGKKTGWWKMKPENEADGTIVGLVWGTPGLANEGKVIGFEVLLESGRVVNACNISRALMDEFTEAVHRASRTWREVYDPDVNPYDGWACQISYMEETPDGSLRHPTFVCFRGTEEDPCTKM